MKHIKGYSIFESLVKTGDVKSNIGAEINDKLYKLKGKGFKISVKYKYSKHMHKMLNLPNRITIKITKPTEENRLARFLYNDIKDDIEDLMVSIEDRYKVLRVSNASFSVDKLQLSDDSKVKNEYINKILYQHMREVTFEISPLNHVGKSTSIKNSDDILYIFQPFIDTHTKLSIKLLDGYVLVNIIQLMGLSDYQVDELLESIHKLMGIYNLSVHGFKVLYKRVLVGEYGPGIITNKLKTLEELSDFLDMNKENIRDMFLMFQPSQQYKN